MARSFISPIWNSRKWMKIIQRRKLDVVVGIFHGNEASTMSGHYRKDASMEVAGAFPSMWL